MLTFQDRFLVICSIGIMILLYGWFAELIVMGYVREARAAENHETYQRYLEIEIVRAELQVELHRRNLARPRPEPQAEPE